MLELRLVVGRGRDEKLVSLRFPLHPFLGTGSSESLFLRWTHHPGTLSALSMISAATTQNLTMKNRIFGV
jgi:alkylhydroperoxidase family enzyme